MKKFLFMAIMMMFITLSSIAQEVKFLFNSNFKFVTDDEKEFVVIPMDGYSQDSLFRAVSSYLDRKYTSKTNEITKFGNEQVTLSAFITDAYYEKVMGLPLRKHMICTYSFNFKDGKFRVNAPVVNKVITGAPTELPHSFAGDCSNYFKNGKLNPKKERLYNAINDRINYILNDIVKSSFAKSESDEW